MSDTYRYQELIRRISNNTMNNENIVYLLTKEEVSFLAGAMGITSLYGIFSLKKPVDEKQLYKILQNLIEKDFIRCEEDSFVIQEDIKQLILFMNNAEQQRVYRTEGNTLPVKCVYKKGNDVLICEQSYVNERELKFISINADRLEELLKEEGYLDKSKEKSDDFN